MPYVRFVVKMRSLSSGKRLGVIRAAWQCDDQGMFSEKESVEVQDIFKWFNKHLPQPERMSRKRNDSHKEKRALSWFKDSAHQHLERARRLVTLLESHGVAVEMMSTERPGYVVYEDDFQIVAEPFSDTPA
jgi:hypothetical protein